MRGRSLLLFGASRTTTQGPNKEIRFGIENSDGLEDFFRCSLCEARWGVSNPAPIQEPCCDSSIEIDAAYRHRPHAVD